MTRIRLINRTPIKRKPVCTDPNPEFYNLPENAKRLAESGVGLVKYMANRMMPPRHRRDGWLFDELCSAGAIGLLEAAKKFQHGIAAFSTYACNAIRWRILHAINEIRNHRTLTTKRFQRDGESYFYVEAIADRSDATQIEVISRLIRKLGFRKRAIVEARFFKGSTLEECGRLFQITKERVRQICIRAIADLAAEAKRIGIDEAAIFETRGRPARRNGQFVEEQELSFDNVVRAYEDCLPEYDIDDQN